MRVGNAWLKYYSKLPWRIFHIRTLRLHLTHHGIAKQRMHGKREWDEKVSKDGQEHQQFYHYCNVPFQANSLGLVLMITLARMIGCLEGEKKENIPSS